MTTERESSDADRSSAHAIDGKGKRRRRRKKRRFVVAAVARAPLGLVGKIALAACALLAAVLVGLFLVYPHRHGPGDGKVVEIDLRSGSPAELADSLAAANLVASPHVFSLYLRLTRVSTATISGPHLFTDDLSPADLIARLERKGGATRVKVTFPEGFTRFDMARRLADRRICSEAAFLRATTDAAVLRQLGIEGDSAEGFLFPATYELAPDSDPTDIVARLVTELERRYQSLSDAHPLGRVDLEGSLGWRRFEILTLASMIEKEAAVDDERPIIASVFLNRLRDPAWKRKVLQSDPTSGYGCLVMRDQIKACAGYTGKITHDLNVSPENMYSTYVHENLPPGPICNPGVKSIEAVLAPASTKYLYFVARGEGRHAFSETLDAHNNAVRAPRP